MNRSIFMIAVALAALASLVIPPASAEFFFASSTNENILTIEGNGDTATMLLVREKGETAKKVSLSADNVLSIERGQSINVFEDEDFSKALITPAEYTGDLSKAKRVPIDSNGIIDLSAYAEGIYTLNVVVDDSKAYEAIIVIGEQSQQTINQIITNINSNVKIITEIIFGPIEEDDDDNDELSICYFNPNHKDCDPDENGDCPPGFGHNEDDRCIPQGKCPDGYVRADDDETGTCFEKGQDRRIKECPDGSIRLVNDTCPSEEPVIDECEPGYVLEDNVCVPEEPEPPIDDPCYCPPGQDCPEMACEVPEPEPEPEPEPILDEEPPEEEQDEEEEVEDEEEAARRRGTGRRKVRRNNRD